MIRVYFITKRKGQETENCISRKTITNKSDFTELIINRIHIHRKISKFFVRYLIKMMK